MAVAGPCSWLVFFFFSKMPSTYPSLSSSSSHPIHHPLLPSLSAPFSCEPWSQTDTDMQTSYTPSASSFLGPLIQLPPLLCLFSFQFSTPVAFSVSQEWKFGARRDLVCLIFSGLFPIHHRGLILPRFLSLPPPQPHPPTSASSTHLLSS